MSTPHQPSFVPPIVGSIPVHQLPVQAGHSYQVTVSPGDAPLPTPAGSVPLDAVADWVVRYRELKTAESQIKDMLAEARERILECAKAQNPADDAQLTVSGQAFLRRQMVTQSRVDTTRLKRDHPSLAQAYTTTSTYEKLTII